MATLFEGFDWDEGNREKCQKHGVSLSEIERLFFSLPVIWPDPAHSQDEARFLAIGRSSKERYIFAAFTIREREGKRYIRPISARYMHQKEIEHYGQAHPET